MRNNVLTYYQQGLQTTVLEKIRNSLAPHGYLVIGAKEKLPGIVRNLPPHCGRTDIFRKKMK